MIKIPITIICDVCEDSETIAVSKYTAHNIICNEYPLIFNTELKQPWEYYWLKAGKERPNWYLICSDHCYAQLIQKETGEP